MRFFRYRKPSLKAVFGITRAKKRMKKKLGITAASKPFRAWSNTKRRWKRRAGLESELARAFRHGPRTPGGCLVVFLPLILMTAAGAILAAREAFN